MGGIFLHIPMAYPINPSLVSTCSFYGLVFKEVRLVVSSGCGVVFVKRSIFGICFQDTCIEYIIFLFVVVCTECRIDWAHGLVLCDGTILSARSRWSQSSTCIWKQIFVLKMFVDVFPFHIIRCKWNGEDCWNSPSRKSRIHMKYSAIMIDKFSPKSSQKTFHNPPIGWSMLCLLWFQTLNLYQHLQNYIDQHQPITAFWLVFSTSLHKKFCLEINH